LGFVSKRKWSMFVKKNEKYFSEKHSKYGNGFYSFDKKITQEEVQKAVGYNKSNATSQEYAKGGSLKENTMQKKYTEKDELGNPTNKEVLEEMENFIKKEIPKIDDKTYFTDGMKRKEAKRRFYLKHNFGAYAMDDIFSTGGKITNKGFNYEIGGL
jgi:hypothetical protein